MRGEGGGDTPGVGQRFPLLASTRVYGILFLLIFFSSGIPISSPSPSPSSHTRTGGTVTVILEPRVAMGGLIFLRLGGRGRGTADDEEEG